MRKAQASQVFVYAAAMVVTALIVIFGYYAYNLMQEHAETSILTNFESKFTRDVDVLANKYKDRDTRRYSMSSKVGRVCFFDANRKPQSSNFLQNYPLVWDSVNDSVANIFLFKDNEVLSFKEPKLTVPEPPYYICRDNAGGSFELELEGVGGKARIVAQLSASITPELDANRYTVDKYVIQLDDMNSMRFELPQGTLVQFPGTKESIEVAISEFSTASGISETYEFKPQGTSFDPPAKMILRLDGCTDGVDYPFEFADGTSIDGECQDNRVTFRIREFP